MHTSKTSFKPRHCIVPGLLWMLLLAGCASTGNTESAAPPEQPLQQLQIPLRSADQDVMAQIMAAEFALQAGNDEAAAAAYARAAKLSDDPRVLERAAGLMLATGDTASAQATVTRMQALGADDALLARLRAQVALSHGHRDEARAELERVLAPGNRDAWGAVARLLSAARDPALAGVLLEDLATLDRLPTDDETVWVAMSQLGEHLGRHAFAERIAAAAASRFASAQTLAWAGHIKLANGETEAGKALYAKAVQAAPEDIPLRQTFAAALAQLGEFGNAEKLLAAGPQTLGTYAARAAYAARTEDDKALASIYSELQQDAAHMEENPGFLLGQLADTLGKSEQALKWYRQVPLGSEASFDARTRTAVLLNQRGDSAEALALARELQQLYVDDKELVLRAYLLEAQLQIQAGAASAAVAVYDRALQQFPHDPDLLYSRGLSQADAGNVDAAIADFRSVLAADPDNMEAMNALGYTLADSNRQLDEATALLERALANQPDEPAIIDSWGWLQYRLGNLEVAEDTLRRAWDMLPDPDIGVHLAEVLWMHGKHEQAQSIFEAVRAEHPDSPILNETVQRLQP